MYSKLGDSKNSSIENLHQFNNKNYIVNQPVNKHTFTNVNVKENYLFNYNCTEKINDLDINDRTQIQVYHHLITNSKITIRQDYFNKMLNLLSIRNYNKFLDYALSYHYFTSKQNYNNSSEDYPFNFTRKSKYINHNSNYPINHTINKITINTLITNLSYHHHLNLHNETDRIHYYYFTIAYHNNFSSKLKDTFKLDKSYNNNPIKILPKMDIINDLTNNLVFFRNKFMKDIIKKIVFQIQGLNYNCLCNVISYLDLEENVISGNCPLIAFLQIVELLDYEGVINMIVENYKCKKNLVRYYLKQKLKKKDINKIKSAWIYFMFGIRIDNFTYSYYALYLDAINEF